VQHSTALYSEERWLPEAEVHCSGSVQLAEVHHYLSRAEERGRPVGGGQGEGEGERERDGERERERETKKQIISGRM
jgi:hypothetical protein